MDTRTLRISIKNKLDERHKLLTKNKRLMEKNTNLADELGTVKSVLNSPLGNYALEDCADQIVHAILDQAIQASQTEARESPDKGHYVISIHIPPLSINRHIYKEDFRRQSPMEARMFSSEIRKLTIDMRRPFTSTPNKEKE